MRGCLATAATTTGTGHLPACWRCFGEAPCPSTPEMGLLPADNPEAERPGPFALVPGERAGKFRAHFESAESHASASSNEKEYSWSGTPERILAPSAMFTM